MSYYSRSSISSFQIFFYIIIVMIAVGTCTVMNTGDASPDAIRALENQGLTNATIGEWAPMACGEGDTVSREFTATNPTGKRVQGVVCCGLFLKSCTVRW